MLEQTANTPESGCGATVVVVRGNMIYFGNVGDCTAVLCRKGKALVVTVLHTPENPLEYLRVENEGGVISKNRLHHPSWNGELVNIALTRSIGDLFFKDARFLGRAWSGLSSKPSIASVLLRLSDQFLIVASDGFWHVVTPDAAIGIVHNLLKQRKDLNFVCRQLTEMAIIRGSRDNVTVVLIMFHSGEEWESQVRQQEQEVLEEQKREHELLNAQQTKSQLHVEEEQQNKKAKH